jgi:hypothetical protein
MDLVFASFRPSANPRLTLPRQLPLDRFDRVADRGFDRHMARVEQRRVRGLAEGAVARRSRVQMSVSTFS